MESRLGRNLFPLIKGGTYCLKGLSRRHLCCPSVMEPGKHSVVQSAVNDFRVAIACWPVRRNWFACRTVAVGKGLICQTEFPDACLSCHIQPTLYLQYRSHCCGCCNRLGSVALTWVAMRCFSEQQGAFDITLKKIGSGAEPVVLVFTVTEMFEPSANKIVARRNIAAMVCDECGAQAHLNLRVRLPARVIIPDRNEIFSACSADMA